MEFPPPLPLGVVSAGELVDIALVDRLEPGDLMARLNAAVPDGLSFTAVTRLEHGARKLSRVIGAAVYAVRVEPEHVLRAGPDLDAAPQRFLARDEVLWETTRKGEPRRVNIRSAVTDVRWIEEPDDLAALGFLRPGARYLMIRTLLNAPAHARPDEVAAAVLRGDATETSGPGAAPAFEPNHIARVELLGS
jgi:radical SAM-linked protein